MPERIQLKRTKGWRMPENTVKVDRTGKWGNPFPIDKEGPMGRTAIDQASSVGFFTAMMHDHELLEAANYPTDFESIRGKNLACWCKVGTPCHGDVLLKLANKDG